jgi:soluble P-type ATPase
MTVKQLEELLREQRLSSDVLIAIGDKRWSIEKVDANDGISIVRIFAKEEKK